MPDLLPNKPEKFGEILFKIPMLQFLFIKIATPLLGLYLFVLSPTTCFSQTTDTLVKTESVPFHSPKKAALLSTLLPGAGQAYNKKYWKMPIIYAGFFGLAYSFNFNQTRYIKYRDAYKTRIEGGIDPYDGIYSKEDLFYLQKYYNRYRDLTVIGASLLYILNIIDASVDAHMFTFDVSDDLSFNIQPSFINIADANAIQTGLSVKINF